MVTNPGSAPRSGEVGRRNAFNMAAPCKSSSASVSVSLCDRAILERGGDIRGYYVHRRQWEMFSKQEV